MPSIFGSIPARATSPRKCFFSPSGTYSWMLARTGAVSFSPIFFSTLNNSTPARSNRRISSGTGAKCAFTTTGAYSFPFSSMSIPLIAFSRVHPRNHRSAALCPGIFFFTLTYILSAGTSLDACFGISICRMSPSFISGIFEYSSSGSRRTFFHSTVYPLSADL